MRKSYRALVILALLFGFSGLFLSGCVSLSEDVTPPPETPFSSPIPPTGVESTQPALETPETVLEDPGPAEDSGLVTVEVIDHTGGLLLQAGLVVRLEGFDEFDLVFQTTQDLPPSAVIEFSDVPLLAGRVFFASVEYGGAVYRSEIIQAVEDTPHLDLQVQVFDTTTETSGLIIDRLHLLFDFPAPDLVQVSEIFILSNLGSATVVADSPGQASVEFSLPEGAQSLVFEEGVLGQRFLLTDNGFGDTVSIPPGQGVYQVVVSYTLPYERNRLTFVQRMEYQLSAHVVLVPAVGVNVKNSSLQDMGVQSLPESEIRVFSGSTIARGEMLEFKLTGNPYQSQEPNLLVDGISTWMVIGLGILGAGLLAAGVWLYIQSKQENLSADQEQLSHRDRDEILDSIIALEDLFQEGEITEAAFKAKRKQLKAQLRGLSGNE